MLYNILSYKCNGCKGEFCISPLRQRTLRRHKENRPPAVARLLQGYCRVAKQLRVYFRKGSRSALLQEKGCPFSMLAHTMRTCPRKHRICVPTMRLQGLLPPLYPMPPAAAGLFSVFAGKCRALIYLYLHPASMGTHRLLVLVSISNLKIRPPH